MFCKKCGLKLGADNIFCHGCGYKIDTNNTVEEIKTEKPQKKTIQEEVQKEVKNEEIEKEENTIKEEKSVASQSNIKNSANLWEFLCDAWHGRKMVSTIFYRLWLSYLVLSFIVGLCGGLIMKDYDLDTINQVLYVFLVPLNIFIIKCFWSCASNVKHQKLKYGGKIFAIFQIIYLIRFVWYLWSLDRFF